MRSLILTADDLGLTAGVTRGVIEAHRMGAVRSTSLLVTFPAGAEAAELARAEPDLEVGLHLDLVGGWPASDPARVRSLIDPDGRFWSLFGFAARLMTGRIQAEEIAREINAQVERARGWGTPALAWDSHRHVHAMPQVARVVGVLARELGARWVRRPLPPMGWLSVKAALAGASTFFSRASWKGIPGNDWYVDLTSGAPDPRLLERLVHQERLGEVSVHPGYADDDLRGIDGLVERRATDLALLRDDRVRAALADRVRWRVEP